ncbi:phosphoribosylformylglycinamidine synthase subunit PurQ [Kaistia adipata]|uniref:phosphoribosylformylglycinamidine synthase subunit PurQ n=1 Tax=Kaistia adipata TaxID=166954 RepID=UPI000401B069|nr:phosphoribosylformylglycinamidine synthase subunit PurQ [Kaistia adipata]
MKSAVVVFPGSNRERDMIAAIEKITGHRPAVVWHGDHDLPKVDLIVVPGGFSYGDYLRSGAIAAREPIMGAIAREAERGVGVLGVCNGFQILCEAGLLPGVLMRNAGLKFICKEVELRVETTDSRFTRGYAKGQVIRSPVAHGDGNFRTDDETLKRLQDEDRVAFRYVDNPNGSIDDIAGILSEKRNILGMMPHPENLIEPLNGGTDGRPLFEAALAAVA